MTVPVVVTCEHATATVPKGYRSLFDGSPEVLATHRAYDPGAQEVARALARRLGVEPPIETDWTRLLIDPNRSLNHRAVFSEFSPPTGDPRREVLREIYRTHRARVTGRLEGLLAKQPEAIHLAVHTFTPCLNGETRVAEIGLLYDPARPAERKFCRAMRSSMAGPHRIRMNYPYLGASNGLTRDLRGRWGERYLGIELELNHGAFFDDPAAWSELQSRVVEGVAEAVTRRFR